MKNNEKILFLSPFFYPESISTGRYNTHLVKALVDSGAEVDVIASYPFYPSWKPVYTEKSLNGVNVLRGGGKVMYPQSQVLKRLVLETWFSFHVMKYLFCKRNKIRKVVIIFPPVVVMWVVNIMLPKKVTKIGIVHDLQGVMAKINGGVIRELVSGVIIKIEKYVFNSVDTLICLSQAMRDELKQNYQIDKMDVHVCYPFITLDEVANTSVSLKDKFDAGSMHIVYSGALGEKQRPKELLKLFLNIAKSRNDIICHIISCGPIFESLKDDKRMDDVGNVIFHNLVDESELGELYSLSTIQVIPQATGTGGGAFPSKLPNLLSSGVPVFAICDKNSELSKIVKKFDFCRDSNKWEISELSNEIIHFLDGIKGVSHNELKLRCKDKLNDLFGVKGIVELILR